MGRRPGTYHHTATRAVLAAGYQAVTVGMVLAIRSIVITLIKSAMVIVVSSGLAARAATRVNKSARIRANRIRATGEISTIQTRESPGQGEPCPGRASVTLASGYLSKRFPVMVGARFSFA